MLASDAMADDGIAPGRPRDPRGPGGGHPTAEWIRREVVPRLVEQFAPERIIVFDPPDRPADADRKAPGLLVVSSRFEGVGVAERVARVHRALGSVVPVRPLCLTPGEARLAGRVPGPVYAAVRHGVRVL